MVHLTGLGDGPFLQSCAIISCDMLDLGVMYPGMDAIYLDSKEGSQDDEMWFLPAESQCLSSMSLLCSLFPGRKGCG